MESLAQAAGIWLLKRSPDPRRVEVHVVGIDEAKFRRPVVPGDQLRLEVRVLHHRGALWRVRGRGPGRRATASPRRASCCSVVTLDRPLVDPTARVAAGASLGPGVRVGPFAVIGPQVRLGARTVLDSHAVIDGDTTLGEDNHLFPFCSVGHRSPGPEVPRGVEPARDRRPQRHPRVRDRPPRHRAAAAASPEIGSDNLLMAYAHVAHDCQRREPHDLRERGDPGRARDGRGLRHRRRLLGGAPVLPRRLPCLRGRLHRRHEGRAAVLEDGGEPGADLRRQRHRPAAPRVPPESVAAIRQAYRAPAPEPAQHRRRPSSVSRPRGRACPRCAASWTSSGRPRAA